MRFRYHLFDIATNPSHFRDRAEAIDAGRLHARLLNRPVQLVMEYAYQEAPDVWHVGGLSVIQPQTRVDTDDVIV